MREILIVIFSVAFGYLVAETIGIGFGIVACVLLIAKCYR